MLSKRTSGTGRLIAIGLWATLLAACQTTRDSDVFGVIDTDRNGRLTVDEVESYGFKRMFNRFDKNKDKLITADDLDGAAPNLMRQRDLNRDGQVTYEEYTTVGRRLGIVKKFFMAADTDGNGWVSRQEQKAYLATGGGTLLAD